MAAPMLGNSFMNFLTKPRVLIAGLSCRSHCTRCDAKGENQRIVPKDVALLDPVAPISDSDTVGLSESSGRRRHEPVMRENVTRFMDPTDGKILIDMTFGSGGHTKHLLDAANDMTVYALDRDPIAFECATAMAKQYAGRHRIIPMLGRFSDVEELLDRRGAQKESIDGILFDVGVSSIQMDDPKRGFSLNSDGPLDMRMDGCRLPNLPSAYDVVNHADERYLAKILKVYGDEALAKPMARAIVEARYALHSITTTRELARILATVSGRMRSDKLGRPAHIATKAFQAFRIFVNNELNELNYGIEAAHRYLRPGGRLVVLTFHSLEDRIVKRHMKGIDMDDVVCSSLSQKYKNVNISYAMDDLEDLYSKNWTLLERKVVTPDSDEVASNPRSRSAKLRAAKKN